MFRLAPLAVAALLITGCSHNGTSSMILSSEDQCPVTLDMGQQLILTLPSNPTTGFRWELRDAADSILESLGQEVYQSDNDHLVGSGGKSTWRFQARDYGEGRLLLVYQRPWEDGAEPEQHFQCELRVR